MDVTVQLCAPAARPIVERLLQLYEYDISGLSGADVGEDGLFHVMDPDDLWHPPYRVFLIRAGERLAGFAFVTRHPAYLGEGETWLMNEFFVLRKDRRRGVGEQAARTLFGEFPGRWEVAELSTNAPAQAFWRRVIGRYSGGTFDEVLIDSDRWHGPVQSFISKPRIASSVIWIARS